MEFRPLEITSMHATDIKNVNLISKMDVYSVVSISGDPRTAQRSHVVKDGNTSPRWGGICLKFSVDVAAARRNLLTLDFVLRSDRVLGDRVIGEIHVPMLELLDGISGEKSKDVAYQLRTPSGKHKGTLNFSYSIGEAFIYPQAPAQPPPPPPPVAPKTTPVAGEPVMAYPSAANPTYPPQGAYPPPGGPQQYPPHGAYPQPGGPPQQYPPYGYPPPSPAGYGYPPPPGAGYGYQPPVQAPPRKNNKSKLGMGLGAGLLGGLLVGDMMSDVGEMSAYDAGYDDALGGGGGFDF